jgi:hypothetical protein
MWPASRTLRTEEPLGFIAANEPDASSQDKSMYFHPTGNLIRLLGMENGGVVWAVFFALGGLVGLASGASGHPAIRGGVLLSALLWCAYVVRDKSGRFSGLSPALALGVLVVCRAAIHILGVIR